VWFPMTDPFDACRGAYEQGQRDAIAAAVQIVEELPCKCNEGADYCDGQTDAIAAILMPLREISHD